MGWLLDLIVPAEALAIRAFIYDGEIRPFTGLSAAEWDRLLAGSPRRWWIRKPRPIDLTEGG